METLKLRQVGLWRVQSWDSNPRSVLSTLRPLPRRPGPQGSATCLESWLGPHR